MATSRVAVSSMTNADSFLQEGPATALARLHALGVTAIEISQHIRFDESTIPVFADVCRKLGIDVCAISVHFDGTCSGALPPLMWQGQVLPVLSVEDEFDRIVTLCRQFDCRYVRFAGLPGRLLPDKAALCAYMAALEAAAGRFAQNGITMCMHNHAEEFITREGRWLLDWAMELAPHLAIELDVLNALHGGVQPQLLLDRYAGRVPLLHIQDRKAVSTNGADEWHSAPAGEGSIDWPAVCAAAVQADAEYLIIEQGRFYGRDPYDCIGSAARFLTGCLAQL